VADPKQEQVRSVASVQRALNRLGYGPVKADGIFGSGTKLALERFERDRKLPVSGEMSPRILKELAAASGIAFD
jgi:peptidoglycan hydrolase-like protein with peptidoglycan-binding domain